MNDFENPIQQYPLSKRVPVTNRWATSSNRSPSVHAKAASCGCPSAIAATNHSPVDRRAYCKGGCGRDPELILKKKQPEQWLAHSPPVIVHPQMSR
jgi:hypothetical protein